MSRLPSTGPSLQRWLRQQERKAQRQQQSSAFNRSGTSVTAEGVTTVDGELDVVGNLDVTGTAAFDGNTTIGGNAAITGTLSLPAGIIGNDALTSPVVPQSVFGSITNFALTARNPVTTADVIKTVTITVPAGMTSAVISVISRVFAINNNTTGGINTFGADYFFAQTGIAGFLDTALPKVVDGSGSSDIAISPFAKVLTGLTPGGTFTVTIGACSDYLNWAASASNLATVSGNILWFR